MTKISIIEEIRSNDQILSLPQVLSEVLEEIGKEDFTADSLARIILKDAALTGRILKLANSSFYARFNQINTVHQAVSVLGVTTVKCLALSSSIFHPDKIAKESGIAPKEFFGYVLSIATASEKIAKAIDYEAPEEALIAGLLNDLGIMFFLHHYPAEYKKVLRSSKKFSSIQEAEKEIFGIDHCDVGYHLAEMWRLPDYIVQSIKGHHKDADNKPKSVLKNVVKLASLLAQDSFSGFQAGIQQRIESIKIASEVLGLSKVQVDEISFSLLAGSVDMAEYLGLDIGSYEQMLAKANKEIWSSYLTIENLFKERQELSKKLLEEERDRGAIESKNIALATLSHYVNNAAMAIYGRSQIMRMYLERDKTDKLTDQLPGTLDVVDKAIIKIVAVLAEMREISPIDKVDFYNVSSAMNIDERLEKRIAAMYERPDWTEETEVLERS